MDRPTEWRIALLQFVVLAAAGSALLYVAVDEFAVMVGPLLLILLYRTCNVEYLSLRLEQYWAHSAVAGGADRMAQEFATDQWLHDSWVRTGAPVPRLIAVPADRLAARMAELRAAGPAQRAVPPAVRILNRAAAVLLGSVLGTTLGATLEVSTISLLWPAAVAAVLVVAFRAAVAVYNRRQVARVAAAMRTGPRDELTGMLAPPWAHRRAATIRELFRLLDAGPIPRRPPELRVIELLMVLAVAFGALAGFLLR
ncbi:hypothetical protein [Micromonospora sp. WMMD1274]|uniref:hypothetical protein n=1 Tax=Micromonospora sp. WMMD1274 TaxID=3404116 RepID=UPI003B9468B8